MSKAHISAAAAAIGTAIGTAWAVAAPPRPNCGGDGICTLQHVYGVQSTKVALVAIALYAVATALTHTLPNALERRAALHRGRAFAAAQRAAQPTRVVFDPAVARHALEQAVALPGNAVSALERDTPAVRPPRPLRPLAPAQFAHAASPSPDAAAALPPAALHAVTITSARDAGIDLSNTLTDARFARSAQRTALTPALRPRSRA